MNSLGFKDDHFDQKELSGQQKIKREKIPEEIEQVQPHHSSYQIQWRRYSFSKTELKPQAAKNRVKCGKVNTKRKKKKKMGNWEEGRGKRSSLVSDTYV